MASNEALVTIGIGTGNALELKDSKEPSVYSGTTSAIYESGTSVSGQLLGSMVRDDVAQISLSWNYLTSNDWSEITSKFKQQFINRVRFFDQTKGNWDERDMYVSDRSAGMWRRDPNGNVLGWTGCSLQLTEV